MASEVENNVGFGRSDAKVYTIPSGATSTERVDLGRNYAFIVITCEDASNIASDTTMSFAVSPELEIPLLTVLTKDTAEAFVTENLPTSGTFYLMVPNVFGARFVQPILGTVTDGIVVLKVWGFDPTVVNQPDR
jgi:hypothetical protein